MNTNRPLPITGAIVLLTLMSVLGLITPLLPLSGSWCLGSSAPVPTWPLSAHALRSRQGITLTE